ncbi:MAG TPA: permease, partial [Candidatus Glassbacteria bacterium]|nr:permease [Candidatus Glassbacteria bacterium]
MTAAGEISLDLLDRFNTVFFRTYTYRILENFWELLVELLPYLCAGILIVTLLQRYVSRIPRLNLLRTDRPANIILSALVGMAAPLSVYLAVPLSAVLIAGGFPASVVLPFLVACPLIDPNLLILTYGAFGPGMAAARALAAFGLAVGAGLLYKKLSGRFPLQPDKGLLEQMTARTAGLGGKSFGVALRRQTLFIVRIFSISLLISAAIKALAPPELLKQLFGGPGYRSVLAAIALGVPFYQCGGASIPIMQALFQLG